MNTSLSGIWQIPLDLSIAATLMFASLPLTLTLDMRIYGVPVLNAFYLANILLISVAYLIGWRGRNRFVLFSAAVGFYLSALGFLRWNDPAFDFRSALQDMVAYAGLPVGLALGVLKGKTGLNQLLKWCYAAVFFMFTANMVLIAAGYVANGGNEGRELDDAMFYSDFFICMSFPCVWSSSRGKVIQRVIALAGIGSCAVFAFTSATRSVFLTLIAAVVITAIVEMKRDRQLVLAAAVVVLLAGAAAPGLDSFRDTLLGERLTSTNYAQENRFEELSGMLDQMGPQEWAFGTGFGTTFPSPISDTGVAAMPHIGISAFLFKGGVLGLIFLAVGPCFFAVFKLLTRRTSESDPFLAGVAIYLFQACVSGGWGFLAIFLLGAFLRLGLEKQVRPRKHRMVSPRLDSFQLLDPQPYDRPLIGNPS